MRRSLNEQTWLANTLKTHVYQKRLKDVCSYIIVAFVILMVISYKVRNRVPSEVILPEGVDLDDYPPFEPDILFDFDTDLNKTAQIPKIIHQTWKDEKVPPKFVEGIKSFVENNPDWEYFIWTDESAKTFIIDHYPSLIPLWNGYAYKNDKIRVADALRYAVLYHYGGVYADMDVVNFRSLDGAVSKHGCILAPEPYEQAVLRGGVPFFINNAIMMCKARHPFFKHLVDHLVDFEIMRTVWDSTGPGFVTFQYKKFFNLPREKGKFILYGNRSLSDISDTSPYLYQGDVSLTDERSIYIANTQYFMVTLDEESYPRYYKWCKNFYELDEMWRRSCVNMKRKGLYRTISKYAFTDHKWHFTYGASNFYNYLPIYSFFTATHIKDLVPHVKIYDREASDMIHLSKLSKAQVKL